MGSAGASGRGGVLGLLRGIVPGLDVFALFCFVLAITLDRWPVWASFAIATVANVVLALVLIKVGHRGLRDDRHS
jgi:hypothetical protein